MKHTIWLMAFGWLVASGCSDKQAVVPPEDLLGATTPDLTSVAVPDLATTPDLADRDLATPSGDDLANVLPDLTELPDLATSAHVVSDPATIDFARVGNGASSSPVLVTLTNEGDATSTTITINTSNDVFAIGGDTCSLHTLAPAATCTFTVTFAPTATKTYAGTITTGLSGVTIAVSGEGVTPGQLTTTDSPFSFADTNVGSSSVDKVFTIKNSGATTVASIVVGMIGGTNFAQFEKVVGEDHCNAATLVPNDTCTIALRFKPTSRGGKSASLNIASSGGELNLSMSGLARQASLSASATSLNLGSVPEAGTASSTADVTITNDGDIAIPAGALTFSTGSSLHFTAGGTCGGELAVGASCPITITFNPISATGNLSATLTVTATNAEHSPLTIALTGKSLGPPVLTVTPTPPLAFGGSTIGVETAAQTLTVTNTGDTATGILNVSLNGAQADQFRKTGTEPSGEACDGRVSLAAGASCKIALSFKPTSAGAKTIVNLQITNSTGATTNIGSIATGLGCADVDKDGFFPNPACGPTDCDDTNPNKFASCGATACVDNDGDNHFVGCDRYATVYADCNDNNKLVRATMEIPGDGIDQDCDGVDLTVSDADGIFVAPTGNDTTGDGTKAKPYASLTKAWEAGSPKKRAMFVQAGGYATELNAGMYGYREMWILGGYDAAWTRGAVGANQVTIANANPSKVPLTLNGAVGLDRIRVTHDNVCVELNGGDIQIRDSQFSALGAQSAALVRFEVAVQATNASFTGVDATTAVVDISGGASVVLKQSTITAQLIAVWLNGSFTAQDGSVISGAQLGQSTIFSPNYNGSNDAEPAGLALTIVNASVIGGGTVLSGGAPTVIRNSVIASSGAQAIVSSNGNVDLVNSIVNAPVRIQRSGANVTTDTVRIINSYIEGASGECALTLGGAGLVATLVNNIVRAPTLSSAMQFNSADPVSGYTLVNNALYANGPNCVLMEAATCIAATALNTCTTPRCTTTSGNFNADCPVDATYHLTTNDCVSKGTSPTAYYGTAFVDVDGQARPIGTWDVGPDEK